MKSQKSNEDMKRATGVNMWLIAIVTIIIASLINWFMVTNLAAPKSVYASDINKINNSMSHINDSTTSLNVFTDHQNTLIGNLADSTQTQFDEVNNSIVDTNNNLSQTESSLSQTQSDLSSVKSQENNLKTQTDSLATQSNQLNSQLTTVNQKADNTKTSLDTLTTKVSGLAPGIQIIPTMSSGTISLSIRSDIAQTVAFKLEFRPTTEMSQLATMDAALTALYTTPPVTVTAGSSVRGDYTLYWNTSDNLYHLGIISFITEGTSLSVGANSRTITVVTSGSFEILITPLYPTGTSTGSW
jgi:CII-binding regulator of phage lambda lysogenization HflD